MSGNTDQNLVLGSYEKTQLSRIPVSFLFRSPRVIYQKPGVSTLRDNPPSDVKYLIDLFTVDLFKRKAILDTRDAVYADMKRIISAFSYYDNVPQLPSGVPSGASLGLMAERFISQYIDRMRQLSGVLVPEEGEKIDRRLDIFETAYDTRNGTVFSMEALASKHGLTPERVRQLLVGKENDMGITLCRRVITGEAKVDDFVVNPALTKALQDLIAADKKAYNLSVFMSENGISNDKTCRFILDLVGMDICSTNAFFEPLVIPAEKINSFNRAAGTMVKRFSDEALSVSLSGEMEPFLRKHVKGDDELIRVLLDAVRCSDRFEHLPGDDDDHYALKWQYLQKFPSKAVRILYDEGASMHTNAILDEYNRRAALYGIKPLTRDNLVVGTGHRSLKSEGKTGYWTYVSDPAARKPKVRELIENYLKSNAGCATLDEVVTHVSSSGLNYSKPTIRTYLSAMSYAVEGRPDFFVHADFRDSYSAYKFISKTINSAQEVLPIVIDYLAAHGGRSKIKDLIQESERTTGNSIRDTTLRSMIVNVPDALVMEKLPGHKMDVVLLLPPDQAKRKVEEAFSGRNLPHHAEIISKLKQLIMGYPAPEAPLSKLIPFLVKYIPDGKNKNMIYKIIGNCDEIETRTDNGRLYVRLKSDR